MEIPHTLAVIAGNGSYPFLMIEGARAAGVKRIAVAAFRDETAPTLLEQADQSEWLRVGQLGKLLNFLKDTGAQHAVMAGQIAPQNLFNLRPDFKALMLLARLRQRNAESIFGEIARAMSDAGVELLPATTFMTKHLAVGGLIAGPALKQRRIDDLQYGFRIAKEISRLDIGQTVVVKNGTVLAVEAFEGTNSALKRGGELGRGDAVMVKVSKPKQDLRFDVPVIGPLTLESAHAAGIRVIGVEAGQTLILEAEKVQSLADQHRISIFGITS